MAIKKDNTQEKKFYFKTNIEGLEIKVRLYYEANTSNIATYKPIKKGYKVIVTPVEIEHRVSNGRTFTIETTSAYTGFTDMIVEADRRSSKRYEEAQAILMSKMNFYLQQLQDNYNKVGFIINELK